MWGATGFCSRSSKILSPLFIFLGAILRYHSIGYHIYADDTKLYISFKCNTPLVSLIKNVDDQ